MKGYKTIILDVDGVLFDSNVIKQNNIRLAAQEYCSSKDLLEEFVSYFIFNNGVPREIKIERFFGSNTKISQQVLKHYNELNSRSLLNAPMTPSVVEFLEDSKDCHIWALSGGAEHEVRDLFNRNNITGYFQGIFGGPVSKKVHLQHLSIEHPAIFIGDSVVDYETAEFAGVSFAFMYRYTQFKAWREFFSEKPEVILIKDLSDLKQIQTNKSKQ